MMHKLRGCGLNSVYLKNGYRLDSVDGFDTVAYIDLTDLYKQLARSISVRKGTLSADEFRFLRKRLGLSQAEVGGLGDKTEQAVAKWEKGIQPVPKAEANLLRLKVLSAFGFKTDIPKVIAQLDADGSDVDGPYVFSNVNGNWKEDGAEMIAGVTALAKEVLSTVSANANMRGSQSTYTLGAMRFPLDRANFQNSGEATV